MGVGSNADDSGWSAVQHRLGKQAGQQEVPEVIDRECSLEPVDGNDSVANGEARVVHQDVQSAKFRFYTLGKVANRLL